MVERTDKGITRTSGMNTWRAGCGESRTSGSEGGPGRPTSREADRAPWSDPYTYCRTFAGWVYVSFVLDVFSRRVVGWQVSTSLRTDLALDALDMGLWTRRRDGHDTSGVVHHSDRGIQYLAIRYTERLAEAGAVASVGSRGDSYDNAMAEALNSLFKGELVRNRGPWKNIDDLEVAIAEWVDWYNHRRLHGEIGLVPPVEFEANHYRHNSAATTVGASVQTRIRE